MRKDILLPGVAVVGGAAGFLLRRWELSTAFEPDTGLPVAGAPATWALIALTVVVAAVLAVLCRGTHRVFPGGYDEAFGAPNNALYLTVLVAAAFLMAASGLLTFLLYLRHDVTAFSRVLLALMSLVSAACLFVVGKTTTAWRAAASTAPPCFCRPTPAVCGSSRPIRPAPPTR